jgi:hypothetical protein
VILLDPSDGRGPREWFRVSWRGVLLGRGYYRRLPDVLALVDVESLVEVIDMTPQWLTIPAAVRAASRFRSRRSRPTGTQRCTAGSSSAQAFSCRCCGVVRRKVLQLDALWWQQLQEWPLETQLG